MTGIEDIVKKEFSRAFMGYDMREVDYFLDEIIEQMEVYERERQEMLTAMEYLLRELEQFDDIAGDADRQLRESVEAVRRAAAPRTRAMHVNPIVPQADAEEEPAPEAAGEAQVLEEYELYNAAPQAETADGAAGDGAAEPEAAAEDSPAAAEEATGRAPDAAGDAGEAFQEDAEAAGDAAEAFQEDAEAVAGAAETAPQGAETDADADETAAAAQEPPADAAAAGNEAESAQAKAPQETA